MSHKKLEKQVLPNGWVVKQSKSYPDRVYYFNTLAGVSTWEIPIVLKPYLKSSGNKLTSAGAGNSKSQSCKVSQLVDPCADIQEAEFSPTQDSDDEGSLDLEQVDDTTYLNCLPQPQSRSSGNIHPGKVSGNQSLNSEKVTTGQPEDHCRKIPQQALSKTCVPPGQNRLPAGETSQPHPDDKGNEKRDGSQTAVQKKVWKEVGNDNNNSYKSVDSLSQESKSKTIHLSDKASTHSTDQPTRLKRSAESVSHCSNKTNKRLKTSISEISDFSDTRKVVKRSPSSALDTFNLSPRDSSPDEDNLLLSDLKKCEDIQSWINHLESDDPTDSFSEGLDPNLDQTTEGSRNFSEESSNRRVMVQSNDSGYLSMGDTSNLSNITMTIKNNGPVKKTIINPWKGVHENPVSINHNRREEISMEIDEVQQVLNKEDERQIEEMDVSDMVLKEVRDTVKKCPCEVIGKLTQAFTTDHPEHIHSVDQNLYIVIDTNVFINNLAFVEDLRDNCFENFGPPVLVIPWVVMQELDALKSNKSSAAAMSMKLGKSAREAVGYIYQCFQDNHLRVIGQSATQAAAASTEFQAKCNDDRILQTCMQCQKNHLNSTVVLLTNDKNLMNKAQVCKIPAFDRFLFLNGIKSLQPKTPNLADKTKGHVESDKPSEACASYPADVPPKDHSHILDEMLCKLKMWLKNALSSVLEREMKSAYDDIWLEIVYRKPPWTLSDVLECFKKHWIAVFGQIYQRSLSTVVDRLCARFKPVTHFQVSIEILLYLLNDCLELLEEFNKQNKNDSQVTEAVTGMKKCEQLCRDLKAGGIKVNSIDEYLEGKQSHTEAKTEVCMDKNKNNVDQLSIEDVESKLTNIWDVVYFCCADFQSMIDSKRKNDSTDPEQMRKMFMVSQKLIPALDAIRYEYEQAIRFSPKEIMKKSALVHGLCVQLNSFYIRLNLKARDGALEVANLQALFGMESKRQMLKDGLDHLDKMIHKIHEQVRLMQG